MTPIYNPDFSPRSSRRRTVRRTMRGWLLVGALLLTACGASDATTTQPDATAAPDITAAATTTAAAAGEGEVAFAPVTGIMEKLGIKGEQYAALGDPEAPITVVEFSDYGCPFCRRYSTTTFSQIKEDYIDTGKVYYVFKDYPIKQLHPQAEIASQAAECAGEQGKYWEMHETLFSNPQEWDTTEPAAREAMTKYAGDIGLDDAKFATCMDPGTTARADVEANIAEGRHLNLTGTPSFVINGKLLAGAQPFDVFQRVFDRELAAAGAAE